jgi:putative ABC transport system permease protein
MRLYRALLRLFPASFRNEYGDEMAAIVARRLRGAGALARLLVWLEVVPDAFIGAARVHGELLRQDAGYAARTLARSPAFTLTAILVSALGIGATTAAFSIADYVLVRPLPFEEPHRLVRLYQEESRRGYSRIELSPPNFRDWRRMATGFESMGAFSTWSSNLVGDGDPMRVVNTWTTSDVLPILGVRPLIGRLFTEADDRYRAPGTVVLSYGLWQERFGGDPHVVGRTILLSDEPHLVIGVMPPGFYFPSRDTQLWTPIRFAPAQFEDRTNRYLDVIARVRDGVTIPQAHAQLRAVAAQLEREHPTENADTSANVVDLRATLPAQSRTLILAMFGAAACLLLIACTNLGNLLLARALGRRRELAVRTALGAGRERLVRQLLTEAFLLAAVGGALGVAVAVSAVPLAARLVPDVLPIAGIPPFDGRMLLAAAAVTAVTGIGFGVLHALRAGRVDLTALAEGARGGSGPRVERLRAALIVAEVSASVVLLISAGLLVRALETVQRIPVGFDAGGVLTLRTALPLPKYERTDARARFYAQVLSEVRALPGVAAAGYISFVPLGPMRGGIWPVTMDGRRESEAGAPTASLRFVTSGYFRALRIPVVLGRDVDDARDTQGAPFVAVVSESLARQHWPGVSPIGRQFFIGLQQRTVVGVVGDVRVRGLERRSEPQVYLPHQQVPDGGLIGYNPQDLVIRSASGDPAALLPAVRAIVARTDPRQPISNVGLLSDLVARETTPRSVQLRVLGSFAALALLLAAVGLHGLVAFNVSAQARDIGVRLALGAAKRNIVSMVVGQALALAAAGLALGLGAGYAVARTMESLLAGVSPADALTYAAVAVLVLTATLAGTVMPVRRALRVDPATAMRAG